jgi:hypothetical protein
MRPVPLHCRHGAAGGSGGMSGTGFTAGRESAGGSRFGGVAGSWAMAA